MELIETYEIYHKFSKYDSLWKILSVVQ